MSLNETGSYVTHAKLPELGSGEIVYSGKGTIRIRFAAGEKAFDIEAVTQHLAHSTTAPAPTPLSRLKRPARKKIKA